MRRPNIDNRLRHALVQIGLAWQEKYGVSPANLSVIAALDAAMLVGLSDVEYAFYMQDRQFSPPVEVDFVFERENYIVTAYRQAGQKKTRIHTLSSVQAMEWDYIVFLLYDSNYSMIGAWQISRHEYVLKSKLLGNWTPEDYQMGKKLFSGS